LIGTTMEGVERRFGGNVAALPPRVAAGSRYFSGLGVCE
jgi:hypothetical protein